MQQRYIPLSPPQEAVQARICPILYGIRFAVGLVQVRSIYYLLLLPLPYAMLTAIQLWPSACSRQPCMVDIQAVTRHLPHPFLRKSRSAIGHVSCHAGHNQLLTSPYYAVHDQLLTLAFGIV